MYGRPRVRAGAHRAISDCVMSGPVPIHTYQGMRENEDGELTVSLTQPDSVPAPGNCLKRKLCEYEQVTGMMQGNIMSPTLSMLHICHSP